MPSYAAIASAEGPNGLFATLESSRLIIRCAETKLLLRNIDLDAKLVSSVRQLKWYRPSSPSESKIERLLLATAENVYVYEVQNQRWTATVKKICGEGQTTAHVDFGANEDEILAYSSFGLKCSLSSVQSGGTTEIRDPKSPAIWSHSLRKSSGHLAFLTRSGAKDVLTVLKPGGSKRELEYSVPLPTIDAQGVRWSPDGKWLAVWDAAASAGSSLLIYTAMGQLFRRLSGASSGSGGEDLGFGIQRVEWDRENRYLAVAANDGKIVLLSTKTFTPAVALDYPSTVGSAHASIHEEQIASDGSRAYGTAQQPATPPPPSSVTAGGGIAGKGNGGGNSPLGFTHMSISPSADLLACVPAKTPSTVWIHSIHPNPQLTAVLIHHGNVRQMQWHPHQHGLLLIHCSPTSLTGTGMTGDHHIPNRTSTSNSNNHGRSRSTSISTSVSTSFASHSQSHSQSQSQSQIYIWGYDLPEPLIVTVPVPVPVSVPVATATATANQSSPITRATWLNSAIKTQAVINTASTCTLLSVLDLSGDDDLNRSLVYGDGDGEGEYYGGYNETPRPKPPTNVTATPATVLGYDPDADADAGANGPGETPSTAARGSKGSKGSKGSRSTASSSFSPVKMDTARLTRTLGFRFTSLRDEEGEGEREDDTFEFKRGGVRV